MSAGKKKSAGRPPRNKGRLGAPQMLLPEQYEKLWKAYCEKQQIKHSAEQAGVSQTTARKYIKGKADPKRGMEPIHERWLKVDRQAKKKADYDLATARAQNLRTVRHAKSKIMEKLTKFDVDKLSEDKVPQALKELVHLEEKLLGADDLTLRVKGDSAFEGWSREELLQFALTGREPSRIRDAASEE